MHCFQWITCFRFILTIKYTTKSSCVTARGVSCGWRVPAHGGTTRQDQGYPLDRTWSTPPLDRTRVSPGQDREWPPDMTWGYPPSPWQATHRAVCLLRSRRRTFLMFRSSHFLISVALSRFPRDNSFQRWKISIREDSMRILFSCIFRYYRNRGCHPPSPEGRICGVKQSPPTMYRSATVITKESVSRATRHDLPKPKPPLLRPAHGSGRLSKSLEYSTEGTYGTGVVAARQNKSVRAQPSAEVLTSDTYKIPNRRTRSNTWILDQSAKPKREVTIFEFKNESDSHGSSRTYRIHSESGLDDYSPGKTVHVKWDDTKSADSPRR